MGELEHTASLQYSQYHQKDDVRPVVTALSHGAFMNVEPVTASGFCLPRGAPAQKTSIGRWDYCPVF